MTSTLDIEALRAAAEKATPGEWRLPQTTDGRTIEGCTVYGPVPEGRCLPVRVCFTSLDIRDPVRGAQQKADAAYIVAAQPAAVLALIAQRDALLEAAKDGLWVLDNMAMALEAKGISGTLPDHRPAIRAVITLATGGGE